MAITITCPSCGKPSRRNSNKPIFDCRKCGKRSSMHEEETQESKAFNSHKKQEKINDDLYSLLVRQRVDFKSEYSGHSSDYTNAHHLFKKTNYHLRYCLENGICLTQDEHAYKFNEYPYPGDLMRWIEDYKGKDFFDRMQALKHRTDILDLRQVKSWLLSELRKLK